MRQTFDSSMPVHEQLMRASAMRKVGRKHCKKRGPGSHKPKVHMANVAKHKTNAARKHKAQVAEYFAGTRETHPVLRK